MKILNISLCNFRNFRGVHEIDLAPNSATQNKNIILIGGYNGAGKTTILESLKLCLFGKRIFNSNFSKENYQNYLLLGKNKNSNKENDDRFYIKIKMEIDETYPTYELVLKRSWNTENGQFGKEAFSIYHKEKPLEIIPKNYWEDFIVSIIPPFLSNYFFFDGERVKDLASGYNAEDILKASIKDLVGLNLYERLNSDLDLLINKINTRNINQPEVLNIIKEKEDGISNIDKKIAQTENSIKNASHDINELSNRKNDIEDELKRKSGAFAKEMKKNQNQMLKLKDEINNLNNEIRQICGESLPFLIASDIYKELLEQLRKEKRSKELKSSKSVLKEINKKVNKKIESSSGFITLTKDQHVNLKGDIDDIFTDIYKQIEKDANISLIHDLTSAEMAYVENIYDRTESSLKIKLDEILKTREKKYLQVKKLREKLGLLPSDSFIKEYVDKLANINTQIDTLTNKIEKLKSDIQCFKEEKSKLDEEIRSYREKVICMEEDNRKINISNRVRYAIKDFSEILISTKIKELEDLITEMFRKLANKKDMVKEIRIDQKTFNTILIDYKERIVNKENISTGEKEIYALSILWGLSKISHRRLPIIIDSPLAKLDKSHVDNITENFFPNAGDQVILLSHDREIDKELYKKMTPHLYKAYILNQNEVDKVSNGYFFD